VRRAIQTGTPPVRNGMTKMFGVAIKDDRGEWLQARDPEMLALAGPIAGFALTADARAFFGAWLDSPLLRPIWARHCMSASSSQSVMNSVRSTLPISRKATASSCCRG
jgi:hypothetical protein